MPVRISSTLSLNMDKETLCIFQLGFAFLLVFTAFNSAGYIQEGVLNKLANSTSPTGAHISKAAGYNSLATIYAVFTVANLFASAIVNLLTAKWAMALGAFCYLLFMLGFVIGVMEWSLYLTSAALGFGASVLWTGQGTYITQNSNSETIGRNSAISWSMLQMCSICGGLFLYFAIPSDTRNGVSRGTVLLVYGTFSAINAIGIVLLVLLRQPTKPRPTLQQDKPDDRQPLLRGAEDTSGLVLEEESDSNSGVLDGVATAIPESVPRITAVLRQAAGDFKATLRLGMTKDMALLTPGFFFTGVETAFWTGVYGTCLTNTGAFHLGHNTTYALNAIFIGLGEVLGGGAFGLAGKRTAKFGRNPIILLGVLSHTAAFFAAWLILPSASPIQTTEEMAYWKPTSVVVFTISFLLGLADACWNTQIYSLLGDLYKDDSAPAFALFKFWQSLAATCSFVLSSSVGVEWQLAALTAFSFAGCLTFLPVEFAAQARARDRDPKEI